MRFYWEHLAAGAVGVITLVLAWFVGPIFHMSGANAWVLRGAILLLGAIVIIGLILYARAQHPQLPAVPSGRPSAPSIPAVPSAASSAAAGVAAVAGSGSGDPYAELDYLVREAAGKVAAARLGGAKLTSLPAVFVLGDTGSGKTSVMMQCGLDAELLAGQVYQENAVAPTRSANLWFARKTVFIEAGGPLVEDANGWLRLVRRLVPGRLGAIFGSGVQVPRAAVVCCDCEMLVKEVSPETIAGKARKLQARLQELAYQMGINLPVYVFFTRADTLPYFEDFVGTFSNEEISQVLGTTLPMLPNLATGVYAEQESRRLTTAFNGLFSGLADCRPGLLSRERNPEKQAGLYEFPRQFRKLSKPVTQFLVDLCRPSHLRSGPFLRGFYFVGRRTVAAPAVGSSTSSGEKTSLMPAPGGGFNAAATSILTSQDALAQPAWAGRTSLENPSEPRRTLQSVFLSHIFSQVILQDRAAQGASGSSSRTDVGKRILFASACFLSFIFIIAFLISFFSNAALVSRVRQAAQDLSIVPAPTAEIPTEESLRRLDALRQSVAELSDYDRNGAPLHLRWGLFTGGDVFPDARAIYFQYFDKLLFDHTRRNLLNDLRTYRGEPQSNADSGAAYDSLKAYLLTTSEYKRNSGTFLSDFLMKEWNKGLDDPGSRRDIIQQQFDFYSSELTFDNPYSKASDPGYVEPTRAYLNKMAGIQRIYLTILAAARQKTKAYRFASAHPDAAEVVRVTKDVDGPFTADGWKVMDDNLKNAGRFLQGEEWVLGKSNQQAVSSANLEQDLRTMYDKDFISQWRDLLSSASVVGYASFGDAARKLDKLSGNSSPLLALLCDVSDNTNVGSATIRASFQAPQSVVAPGCAEQKKYKQSSNDPYMNGLLNLRTCTQQIEQAQPAERDAYKTQCAPVATQALVTADQIAQGFTIDPDGHMDATVRNLLESPIKALQRSLQISGGSTTEMCRTFNTLRSAYPFNSRSSREASLAEFNAFFAPNSGMFSQFLASQRNAVTLQGSTWIRTPSGTVPVGAGFLHFVNQMYAIQQAVYPNNATEPHYEYSVTAHLPAVGGYSHEKLIFDGQELSVSGSGSTKKFIWPGSVQGAVLNLSAGSVNLDAQTAQGQWAVARFFSVYRWTPMGNTYRIEGALLGPGGQPITASGKPVTVRFEVDFRGVPLFEAGYLSGFSCPAKMTQ
jgi:type VI secretion system protein ImpL